MHENHGGHITGFRTIKLISLALLLTAPVRAENWPTWRGPNQDGISAEKNPPVRWGAGENLRWRTPLPEPGNSTPIVWEDRVFVTQNQGDRRTLVCFNRADGSRRWQSGVRVETTEQTHGENPYASASPVTDGDRIVVWFGTGGLVCYDFEGEELWRTDLGPHDHQFGYGGSPVLHDDLCFLNFGPGRREFLVAVDKRTGREVWRHSGPVPPAADIYGTWSTPVVARWEGRTELISALRGQLAGLDPKTGQVLWETGTLGIQAKASPVAGEGIVVMSGDMASAEVAVRLGGSGDVSDSHLLWQRSPPKRRVGTGVIQDGFYYGPQTLGLADCIRLETGEVIWEERLRGSGANNAIWSSPVLADGKLFYLNQNGDGFVVRAGTEFELLAMNPLGERSNSSVVLSKGDLFIRTYEALWCFRKTER